VGVGKVAVAGQGGGDRLAAVHHGAKLAAAGDPEVERGADALRGEREAVAGGVADEEDAIVGGRAEAMRNPVPLVADGLAREVLGEHHRRVPDVEARVEGAHADARLVGRREAPAVARRHVSAVDPDLHLVARAPGMDLQAPGERGIRGLIAGAQDPAPAEGVDDQWS